MNIATNSKREEKPPAKVDGLRLVDPFAEVKENDEPANYKKLSAKKRKAIDAERNNRYTAYADQRMAFADIIGKRLRLKSSVWSIWEVADFSAVAFKGEGLSLTYTINWGNRDITISLPENPTWADMWKAANKIIYLSGDRHHTFIENFKRRGKLIDLETGS